MSEKNDKITENEVIEGQITVDEALNLEKTENVEKEELTPMKEDKKTKGFKLTPTTIAELAVLEGKFSSAEDLMKTMISTYRTQRVNESGYESRVKDVDQFNSLLESLRILFISSVELEKTTTDRVAMEFRSKIDSLTKSVATLTAEKIKLTEELKENIDILNTAKEDNEELSKQLELVQNLVNTREEELRKEREQINTLTVLLNEFKDYKEVNVILEKENKELNKVNIEKENYIKKLDTDKLLLQKDIDNLNKTIIALEKVTEEVKEERQQLKLEKEEYKVTASKLQAELNNKRIEVAELKGEIKELTSKLIDAENVKKELTEIKSENKKLLNELRIYDKGYEDFESRFSDKLVERDEKIKELEKELAAIKQNKVVRKNKKGE